jgi:hypothetical protein
MLSAYIMLQQIGSKEKALEALERAAIAQVSIVLTLITGLV